MRRIAYGFELLIWCVLNDSLKLKTVFEDIANIKLSRQIFINKDKEGKNAQFTNRNLTYKLKLVSLANEESVAKAKRLMASIRLKAKYRICGSIKYRNFSSPEANLPAIYDWADKRGLIL